jgi:TetR/AcrR family acrAB operon transcriptional repressor
MARRTKEEAQATRSSILDTAERIFSEKGVSHTSLADIANAAGVTRGAIYWHFKNKCEVFTAMMDRELLPLDELFASTLDSNEAYPLKRLRDITVDCLCDIQRNPRRRTVTEIVLTKWEHTADMQPVIDRKQSNILKSLERLERTLDNAVALGQLPENLDTRRGAVFLHSLIVGVLMDRVSLRDDIDLLIEAPRLLDGYFDMLRLSPALLRT